MRSQIIISIGLILDLVGVIMIYSTTSVKDGMNEFLAIATRNSPHLERTNADRVRDRKVHRTTCIRMSGLALIPTGFALQAVGVWL